MPGCRPRQAQCRLQPPDTRTSAKRLALEATPLTLAALATLAILGLGRSRMRNYSETPIVNDPNVKGLIVGICLAVIVAIFASLAVDTFFGREQGIESPLRGQ